MRLLILLALVPAAFAQQTFEAASVKAASPDARRMNWEFKPGGLVKFENIQLRRIVQVAYGVLDWQIDGPRWIADARYDITARAAGDPTKEEMLGMLRALLEDRFKLHARRETREGIVYNLVVAKGGAKLQAPAAINGRSGIGHRVNAPPGELITVETLEAHNVTMAEAAADFSDLVGRKVIDRTGITGQFDFEFSFSPDDAHTDGAPSIFSAIQTLGLKLESGKGPVEMLVIDHAEKPSEN
jgi:uncharacterized protein (TIGR03435 family)